MDAAEIVVGEVQSDGGFQMRQLLAECIRESRKTAHRHSHSEVLALYETGRNFLRVGIAVTDLGYNLRDACWGVPRIGALSEVPEQFHKLREINVRSKALRNANRVVVQSVGGELHAIRKPMIQIPQESGGIGTEALANAKRGNQFGFRVNGDIYPLVTDLGGFAFADAPCFLLNERPDFINLQIPRLQVSHSRIHHAGAALSRDNEQPHDCISVQSRQSLRAANRAAFQKAMQRTLCRNGIRRHRIARQFVVGLAEGGIAGSAAPALNAALTEVAKFLADLVLAFGAGHGVSPLAFCGETSQNTLGSEAWVTPRFGLAPPTVRAADGAHFASVYPLGWNDGHFHRWTVRREVDRNDYLHWSPSFLKRSVLRARGVSIKSFLLGRFGREMRDRLSKNVFALGIAVRDNLPFPSKTALEFAVFCRFQFSSTLHPSHCGMNRGHVIFIGTQVEPHFAQQIAHQFGSKEGAGAVDFEAAHYRSHCIRQAEGFLARLFGDQRRKSLNRPKQLRLFHGEPPLLHFDLRQIEPRFLQGVLELVYHASKINREINNVKKNR